MSLDIDVPSIQGLDLDEADKTFVTAGWQHPDHPGHNASILFSSDGQYVARLAKGDPGFEAFAAMCDAHDDPHLPKLHVNYLSDTGVHLTIMDRLKRCGHDDNPEAAKQAKAVQDFIWGRQGDELGESLRKTLRLMLDEAQQAHEHNPGIYEGIDFAGDNSTNNILFREKADGSVQLVLTDAFARRGPPVPPDWDKVRRTLSVTGSVPRPG